MKAFVYKGWGGGPCPRGRAANGWLGCRDSMAEGGVNVGPREGTGERALEKASCAGARLHQKPVRAPGLAQHARARQ